MPPRHERSGAAFGGVRTWSALLGEVCATALLVWLGVGSALSMEPEGPPPPLGNVALAFGCVVVGCIVAFGSTSGAHMNPAVSLTAALSGRLSWPLTGAYVAAQLSGAVLGFAALLGTLPTHARSGLTLPAERVGPLRAAALEAAFTGLLALACCAAWAEHDAARPDPTVPLKLGLLVAGLVYAGGEATGCSLNPARSFAPALLQNHWEHHWVYWVGPLGGAVVAALLYRLLSLPARRETTSPEVLPLADKA